MLRSNISKNSKSKQSQFFLQICSHLTFKSSKLLNDYQFRTFYGVGPLQCETIWNMICKQNTTLQIKSRHLLFGLLFLKVYSVEEVHSRICNVTRKCFRVNAWRAIQSIADLKVVSYMTSYFYFFN